MKNHKAVLAAGALIAISLKYPFNLALTSLGLHEIFTVILSGTAAAMAKFIEYNLKGAHLANKKLFLIFLISSGVCATLLFVKPDIYL